MQYISAFLVLFGFVNIVLCVCVCVCVHACVRVCGWLDGRTEERPQRFNIPSHTDIQTEG